MDAAFDPPEKDRKFVTALARGLEVLACFQPGDRYLGNGQIAERTGLPKPTVSRLTYTLTALGYLRFLPDLNKYRLGTAVIGFGHALLAQMDIRRVARPLMQALAEHAGGAVNLGVRNRLSMIYLDTYRNTATYSVQLDVGSQVPIAGTSMGLAYLCALPDEARAVLLEEIRRQHEAAWPQIAARVEEALRDYRERGFCLCLGGWRREVNAIAVPLISADGGETSVFSCSGPSFQLQREQLVDDIGPRLLNLVGNVRTAMSRL
jgi:DNA-binding IclR family transcriptional regulator